MINIRCSDNSLGLGVSLNLNNLEHMSRFTLTIIVILASILTVLVYTTSHNIEIKALITLMDVPIVLLIAHHLATEEEQ